MKKISLSICLLIFAISLTGIFLSIPKVASAEQDLAQMVSEAEDGAVIYLDGEYTVSSAISIIKNITICKSGTAQKAELKLSAGFDGRHISVDANVSVTLKGLTFTGHNDPLSAGGGVQADKATLEINDCSFLGNASETYGGAIYVSRNFDLKIKDSDFKDNTAANGGAVCAGIKKGGSASTVSIENTLFADNAASTNGGAVYGTTNCAVSLINCRFSGNEGVYGGAVSLAGLSKSTVVTDCEFSGGVSEGNGGGLYMSSCAGLAADGCKFTGNSAYSGGGISVNKNTDIVEVKNAVFKDNNALQDGGGLYLYGDGSMNIEGSHFDGNRAYDDDGVEPILLGRGGGLCINGMGKYKVSSTAFIKNAALHDGGGLYISANDHPNDCELYADNCVFYDNCADASGGGLYSCNYAYNPLVTAVTNSTFALNKVRNMNGDVGGAIYGSERSLWLFGNLFCQNLRHDVVLGIESVGNNHTQVMLNNLIENDASKIFIDIKDGAPELFMERYLRILPGGKAHNKISDSDTQGWKISDQTVILPPKDISGNPRVWAGAMDIGASEIYKLPVSFMSGGMVVATLDIEEGACAEPPADPVNKGYKFGGWYYDADYLHPYRSGDIIDSSVVLYAKWEKAALPGWAVALIIAAAVAIAAGAVIIIVLLVKKRKKAAPKVLLDQPQGEKAPVSIDELIAELSMREREVLRLLVEGRSAKEIAAELSVAFDTARNHVRNIYRKLDVSSRTELVIKYRGKL